MSGVAGGWSAWASDAFHVYGPAALVFGFFAAALAFAVIVAGLSWSRAQIAKASLLREAAKAPSPVNPLDAQFDSKRISLNNFVNPLYEPVVGKIFARCELVGPATVMLSGSHINNSKFNPWAGCAFVICPAQIGGFSTDVIIIQDCNFVDYIFINCVVLFAYGDPTIAKLVPEVIFNHDRKDIIKASKGFSHDKP